MKSSKRSPAFNVLSSVLLIILSTINLTGQEVVKKQDDGIVNIWIEAEAGDISSPMKVWYNEYASGGQFIEVQSGNNNLVNAPGDGHITYKFTVSNASAYKVWGRVIASMDDEDAFWVKMDDQDWIRWKDIKVGCNWHWVEVYDNDNNNRDVIFNLDEGPHTFTVTYQLDQTRLDKILITNDLKSTPDGTGPGVKALYKTGQSVPMVSESVLFDASGSASSEGDIVKYEWDFGDGEKAVGKSVSHSFQKKGDYIVQLNVKDSKGLACLIKKDLTVYTGDPVADFKYTPDRSKEGESISFDASDSFDPNGNIENYLWDFGDGSTAEGAKIRHSYSSAGEYYATLTITDSERKTVKITRLVTVTNGQPKKVILDTDMCLDVDDVGALGVLHALANNNEAEILAVCYNEAHPYAAPAIDAINTWYGRGDIPIGIYKKPLFEPDYSPYLEPVSKLPHDLDTKSAPGALEVYQKVLQTQPDGSVTIISVGFLNNLSDLLRADPDLVASKVKELVIMGGTSNDDFNLSRHKLVAESENVIKNWPTPIVFSGAGGNILTGQGLIDAPEGNPVRVAYQKFFHDNFCGRPSWDEITVLYGVRGLSDYFSIHSSGSGSLVNGYKWNMKSGYRSFLNTVHPAEYYAGIIQDLMMEPPLK